MSIEDIKNVSTALLVKITKTKNKKPRSFTIHGEKYWALYRNYLALRRSNFNNARVFVKYKNGKCNRAVVGIHKSAVAQEIAKYLNLEDATGYTGHCLRRTSATKDTEVGSQAV